MKDFYWDIRPKPEYGTIEIRVFDTPLTVERAAALAGFVQSLAAWFLEEQPFVPLEDDYMVYTYNRFQACRFGLEAVYVEPSTGLHAAARWAAATIARGSRRATACSWPCRPTCWSKAAISCPRSIPRAWATSRWR